jgi:hypothetical protein
MNTSPTYPPGTTLTSAIFTAGTVSNVCTVGTSCYYSAVPAGWTVGANQNIFTNLGPVQMNGTEGPHYVAQTLNYNSLAHVDSANDAINNLNFANGSTSRYFSVLVGFTLGMPQQSNGNDYDLLMIQDASGLYDTLNMSQSRCNGKTQGISVENHAAGTSTPICLTPLQSYYMATTWDLANEEACMWVWTPQGTLIAQPSCIAADSSGGDVYDVRIFSNENGTDSGTTYYQNIMMNWTQTEPTGTATFTNGSTTVTGSGFATGNAWNNSVINIDGTTYAIASVQSSTQLTLASAFSGTTGSASYSILLPLFWTSGATVQPPTDLNTTVTTVQ